MGEFEGRRLTIDELLDRAVGAINSGDRATANELAERVLEVDHANWEAEELLSAPQGHGELRRLTIMFADLVDSTALSTRIEIETYHTVVGRYRDEVLGAVNRYGGHIGNTKGDGLLALFGHPDAHEDDAVRAVKAGLDITREIAKLSKRVQRRFGFDIDVRVGIHRGLVYLDIAQDDVYGFAANLTARICSIADPGTVAISVATQRLVRDNFDLVKRPPERVKGIDEVVESYRVVGERASTYVPRSPLIGRRREVAHLEQSWQRAAAGNNDTAGVAFCGESGIGKSRLGHVAVELAERSGGVVLQLQGSPLHTDVGLHPVRDLLDRECGATRQSAVDERLALLRAELGKRGMDVETMVPLLAPVLGIPVTAGYAPFAAEGNKLHAQIISAIGDYLVARIGNGSALVLLEDMHWFDSASSEVVSALLPAAAGGRVLFVMTSREMAALPDDSSIEVFTLEPLTDLETDDLIAALDPEMTRPDRDAVRGRCGGMPLYIEEVVAKLRELQAGGMDSAVPDTLYEALFARLRSSEGSVRVVEAAATIGSRFDTSLLRSVVDMEATEFDGVLDELRNAAVLEPLGDGTWRFRHELMREVAVELPPPTMRMALHGRVAEALESHAGLGDPDWPSIASHFELARRFTEAASAYQKAATTARLRGALEEARGYLSRALGQLDHAPPGREHDRSEINFRLRRGFLASAALGPVSAEATADFERCLQLASADPTSDELFATLMATFTYYVTRADLPRAQQIVDSLRIGVDSGREWWRAENVGGAGTLSWFRGEFDGASEQLNEAARLVDTRDQDELEALWFTPHDPVVLTLCGLALTRLIRGDRAGAAAAIADGESRAAGLGFPQGPFSTCYIRYIQVWILLESGDVQGAAAAAADMATRAERHGFDQWGALGATFIGYAAAVAALDAGDVDAAAVSNGIATLTGWTMAGRMLEAKVFIPSFDGHLARMLIARGQLAEAASQIAAGLRLADETGMHYYDAELLRLRAKTHASPHDGADDLTAAFDLARHQGAHLFALRAALDEHELHGAAATPHLTEAVARFPGDADSDELTRARSLLGDT